MIDDGARKEGRGRGEYKAEHEKIKLLVVEETEMLCKFCRPGGTSVTWKISPPPPGKRKGAHAKKSKFLFFSRTTDKSPRHNKQDALCCNVHASPNPSKIKSLRCAESSIKVHTRL